ncbi:MAG: PQQ-dependent sugar dehydrogenase [Pirellulales bacterium]|nr:PQQ-dependent sugar dehydrogenase [Pirellulales bacterium]
MSSVLRFRRAALPLLLSIFAAQAAGAQDLLNDLIEDSPFRLELRPYVTLPSSRNDVISMTTRPGDARPYVTTQEGYVFVLDDNNDGTATATQFFNFASALSAAGRSMSGSSGQQGLQSIAFHPDFNRVGQPGHGKLYATYLENRPASAAGLNFLGASTSGSGVNADGVLSEWTFDFQTQQVASSSFRELFRVRMPRYDHPIKQARFNTWAVPGDEDYGLLYLTHGDSNVKHSPNDDPQQLNNALGKMLRIDPLPDGANPYSIPAANPFAGSADPNVLPEIYAYGFRNPHTFSFNRDDAGTTHILLGDIGRNNVEEVNLVVPGGNYGWTKREGTFIHRQLPDSDPDAGYVSGLAPLPADEATLGYVYPVAQYDHDATFSEVSSGSSIVTGFVIRNGSDPNFHNQLVFGDLSRRTVNNMFHADFNEMLAAVTQLDPDDPTRDEPSELTQAQVHSLQIALDHDNDPATPPQTYDNFLAMLQSTTGTTRTDVRFGEGAFGELYVTSKVNGTVYLATNTVPVPGDFNADRRVDGGDFLLWQRDFAALGTKSPADGNRDELVDSLDGELWQARYGQSFGSPAPPVVAVPEPATPALIAWGGFLAATMLRRRRPN